MRRVILAVSSTVIALVLLLGYKSQAAPAVVKPPAVSAPDSGASSEQTGSTGSSSSGSTSGSTGGSSGSGSSSSSSTTTKTATGDSVDTQYGPVQVRVTTSNGKITNVDAVDYPQNDPRDQEINSYAIPQLNQEAVAAGNANIDLVSGATYTSDGYVQSLQSALDKLK